MSDASILLVDPKHPHNVASALRATAIFGGSALYWTGSRVPPPDAWPEGARLPREERMRLYRAVAFQHIGTPLPEVLPRARRILTVTPVAVELSDNAESLIDFVHPEEALYCFGPEDGSLPRSIRAGCHRFVRIPADPEMRSVPLNLAAAVNLVLYDRLAKSTRGDRDEQAGQDMRGAVGAVGPSLRA